MEYTFLFGWRLQVAHQPGRKKPVIAIIDAHGRTRAAATIRGEEDYETFIALFNQLFSGRAI